MDKINERMYQANIELVDRNKLLEEDLKRTQKRIDKAIGYIECNKRENTFRLFGNEKTGEMESLNGELLDLLEILKGEEDGDNG